MRYCLDTEFNGFGGELISLALAAEDGRNLYLVLSEEEDRAMQAEPWVAENVMPILFDSPQPPMQAPRMMWAHAIAGFLSRDSRPVIISDWPDDIRYFCQAIITGPGEMAAIPALTFHMARVDAYPTTLAGAVQHNALWDAMALRAMLIQPREDAA
jgi:hypothetical protein